MLAKLARVRPSLRHVGRANGSRNMCGIVAVIDQSQPPAEANVREICSRMHMRGPDGQGYAAGSTSAFHWALAHQRLSIMDPSARGDQPFKSTASPMMPNASTTNYCGGAALTINGEIYNYKELYAELGNPTTQSSSDCEVILHLYHKLMEAPGATMASAAKELCNKLDGMFAFVLVDEVRGGYVAGRDPCGKKPLYMGVRKDGQGNVTSSTFASELKCLAKEGYNDVVEIPGGHFFTPEGGVQRYHEPAWQFDPNFKHDPSIGKKEVKAALEKACVKRMMSDVDYGLFLSGGVDSCVVGELMRPHIDNGGAPLPSFTVGQKGSPDVMAARAVASALGYEHHERLFATEEALSIIDRVVFQLETYEPELIRSAIPNYFLAEFTSQKVKMVLTGEGADELFAGYVYFEGAPTPKDLDIELRRIYDALGNVNLKRTDRMTMSHGLEARCPFLDKEVVSLMMSLDPSLKMIHDRQSRREKAFLRNMFVDGPIPPEVLWRQKAMQCEGVGENWVGVLQRHCESRVSDEDFAKAAERFPLNTPQTKEEYVYRDIFDAHYGGLEQFVWVWPGGCRAGGAAWDTSAAYTRKGLVDTGRLTHALQGASTGAATRGFSTAAAAEAPPVPAAAAAETTAAFGADSMLQAQLMARPLVERVLTSGADDRTAMKPSAAFANSYYVGPRLPPLGSLVRSSCTCSPLTPLAHATLVEGPNAAATLEAVTSARGPAFTAIMDDIRSRLSSVLELPEGTGVVLGASGTDVEVVPLAMARALNPHASAVRTVISAEKEIGRGVALAAAGLYSNPQTPMRALLDDSSGSGGGAAAAAMPLPENLREGVKATVLANRDASGGLIDATPANMAALEAARAAEEPLILHSVQGTKTNLREPYPPVPANLLNAGGANDVLVVVDACQGRCSNEEIAGFLNDGAAVLVTGSKFYQGPPFSGALLVPPQLTKAVAAAVDSGSAGSELPPLMQEYFSAADFPEAWQGWRSQLPQDENNVGSALRWLGALAEMEAYHGAGTSTQRAQVSKAWAESVVAACHGAVEVFESNGSIVNITVRKNGSSNSSSSSSSSGDLMSVPELKLLHKWLTMDLSSVLGDASASAPVFIGQPVEVAKDFGVVRIALGAPDVRALLGDSEAVLATDRAVIAKINLVANNFDRLCAHFGEPTIAR